MSDVNIVLTKMPHELLLPAPPFLFVDRVLAFDGTTLHCRKQVGYNEPYLVGHFPGNPIVPGVHLIEMANQAGALLEIALRGAVLTEGYLANVKSFTFFNPVRPGDALAIKVERVGELGSYSTVKAFIGFEGEKRKAAKGEVVLYFR